MKEDPDRLPKVTVPRQDKSSQHRISVIIRCADDLHKLRWLCRERRELVEEAISDAWGLEAPHSSAAGIEIFRLAEGVFEVVIYIDR